jgi:hypothetical protein
MACRYAENLIVINELSGLLRCQSVRLRRTTLFRYLWARLSLANGSSLKSFTLTSEISLASFTFVA